MHNHVNIEHQVNRKQRCSANAHEKVEHCGHENYLKYAYLMIPQIRPAKAFQTETRWIKTPEVHILLTNHV
jgi:hypothetical protein